MAIVTDIYNDLLEQIKSGKLREGDKIPNEIALGQTLGVSRITVRGAILRLVSEGYLRRTKGVGTFVTKPKVANEYTSFIESFQDEMQQKGYHSTTSVLEHKLIHADDFLAEKLGLKKGSKIIKIKRLRHVEEICDKPIVLTTVYIPYAIAPSLLELNLEVSSLYGSMKKIGIEVVSAVRELEIRYLSSKTSLYLASDTQTPAHFISSVGENRDGQIIEYSESYYPSDRNKFIIKIER